MLLEMTTWPNIYLQNSASPLMEQLNLFHNHITLILMMIATTVSYIMIMLFFNKHTDSNLLEVQIIEMIWTVTPTMTLSFIATPSLHLLYLMDEINNSMMTSKAVGHQWYCTYECSDFNDTEFDSYMMNQENINELRSLDVDNRMVLPSNTFIRMIVTSTYFIHCWTLPSFGVKLMEHPDD